MKNKKHRYFLSIVASSLLFLLNIGLVNAEDKPAVTVKSGFLDVDTSQFPTALTAEIVNGTIKYVNNKKQARISLKWSLLPLDDTLRIIAKDYNVQPIRCKINNEDLGENGSWFSKLSENCQDYFRNALVVDDQGKIQTQLPDKCLEQNRFQKLWLCEGKPGKQGKPEGQGVGYGLAKTAIPSSQYFGLLRDYLQVNGLVSGNGINYSLETTSTLSNGEESKSISDSDKKITWDIDVYKFRASTSINYYRFVVKASVSPINIYLPLDVTATKLDAKISLKRGSSTIGIFDPNLGELKAINLPVQNPKASVLNPIKSASNELTRTLSLFGSPNLGEVITDNFLGGTRDASLVYGGMIAKNSLEPIVGANLGLANIGDAKFGALIGVGTNSSNTPFYIGPSIQYSILTLSGGLRFATNTNAVDTNFAGIASLDLSQLFGGKREVKELKVENVLTGGDWGKASDEIYRNLALIDYQLTDLTGNQTLKVISLNQIKSCDDKKISSVKLDIQTKGLQFIPRGKYTYNQDPVYILKDKLRQPITQDIVLDACPDVGGTNLEIIIGKK
jgi:hypothetical protein